MTEERWTVDGEQWVVAEKSALPSDGLQSNRLTEIGGATSRSPAGEQELAPPRIVIASPRHEGVAIHLVSGVVREVLDGRVASAFAKATARQSRLSPCPRLFG